MYVPMLQVIYIHTHWNARYENRLKGRLQISFLIVSEVKGILFNFIFPESPKFILSKK